MGNDTPATPAGTPVPAPERNGGKNTKPQGRQGKPRKPMEKPKPATQAVKMPPHMAGGLAPPTHKAANDASKNKPVTNESLVAESVFAVDSGFTPKQREIEFSPSMSGWTQTVDDAFTELRNDSKVQVAKELPIEAQTVARTGTNTIGGRDTASVRRQDLRAPRPNTLGTKSCWESDH